jgi:drug/metabolite transporter (DMT)-like permease
MHSIVPLQIFFIPVILAWSLPNFIFKHFTNYFSNIDMIILYHLVYHIFLLPFILYNVFRNTEYYKSFMSNFKKSPKNLGFIVVAMVSLSILSQYCYFKLLRHYDVTTMVPIIRGLSAIVLLSIGYFIFKENINLMKLVGITLTVFGIYLISQN